VTKIYRNDGGSFTDTFAPLAGASLCSLAWGDYDNDGDLDLAIAGSASQIAKVYRNDGGAWRDTGAALAGVDNCSIAWADYDRDGDLDLAIAGGSQGDEVALVYRNEGGRYDNPPSTPDGLAGGWQGVGPYDLIFDWSPATDAETPQPALTYNLRVGTFPGGQDVMPGQSLTSPDSRLLPGMGNVQQNVSWTLRGLPAGTYYWSVQAVDSGFEASPWAPEQQVDAGGVAAGPIFKVVDLTTGSVTGTDSIPDLLTNDDYKTSKMVLKRMDAGSFKMGDEVGGHNADELPVHTVSITKPFYMGVFEVTQGQWNQVMGVNPSSFTGRADSPRRPVEQVSWNDCQSYLTQLSADTGATFRLPTEAEWEYACKAGTSTNYFYGDTENGAYMWYPANSGAQTHEVGTCSPNPNGLYDLPGNIHEWCGDWYDANYYSSPPPTDDPVGPPSASERVIRGGSWLNPVDLCRSSARDWCGPTVRNGHTGLRVVLAP
jgi:formylglycine-generating enzyme required for sulfatase activity